MCYYVCYNNVGAVHAVRVLTNHVTYYLVHSCVMPLLYSSSV